MYIEIENFYTKGHRVYQERKNSSKRTPCISKKKIFIQKTTVYIEKEKTYSKGHRVYRTETEI